MRNICMIIAYDGSRYHGFQKQGNTPDTIQDRMENVLSRFFDEEITVTASGRTDEGVHAYGQVLNFHTHWEGDLENLSFQINNFLPDDIEILSVFEVPERFHARFDAKWKHYRYCVYVGEGKDVFNRKYEWKFNPKVRINTEKMKEAVSYLLGEHDFTSFCGNRHMKKSAVRTIYDIQIHEESMQLIFDFYGNGFLQYMVRILTGTLLEVGIGAKRPEEMTDILSAKDRSKAGFTAPSKGLCLVEVGYEERE